MAAKSPLLIKLSAAASVEDDPEYREGVLLSAEQQGVREVLLRLEDKQTGQQTTLSTSHISGLWGANKSYLDADVYDELSASPPEKPNPAEKAEAMLDTRTDGLRFYYHVPQASPEIKPADD